MLNMMMHIRLFLTHFREHRDTIDENENKEEWKCKEIVIGTEQYWRKSLMKIKPKNSVKRS